MAVTKRMEADEIANAFNGVEDRKYWRASVAGTRVNPEVHFNSRASMVRVAYRIASGDFTVTFTKASAAFGDFAASAFRSMEQVQASLKATGLPFAAVVDERTAVIRMEYDPRAKATTWTLANLGDDWPEAEPMPFKVPMRDVVEAALAQDNTVSAFSGLDGL